MMKFYFGVYFELVICNVCVSVCFNIKLGIFNNEERKKNYKYNFYWKYID